MESTNISTKKEKPFKINLTVVMSFLAFVWCIFSVYEIFSTLPDAEYQVSAYYYIVLAIPFAFLVIFGGLAKYRNTSKIGWIYFILFVIFAYVLTRLIWTAVSLQPRIDSILADNTSYATDVAREFAVEQLKEKSQAIILFSTLSVLALIGMFVFSTLKALDGEARLPYYLVFVAALVCVYFIGYNEANFLGSMANLDSIFGATLVESRTSVVSLVSVFIVSMVNDYDPEQDIAFKAALAK